jgi:hypothetical protein
MLPLDWLIMMGWDYVTELRPQAGLLFIPQVICEHGEPWWWWCRLGIAPDSSTRALWQSYQQRHLGQGGGMDEGVRILPFQYLRYLKGSLTCRKVLRHGTSGFTSHLKEGVLRIFISIKNPRHGQVWTHDPCVQWQAHLTTTPPRWLLPHNIFRILQQLLTSRGASSVTVTEISHGCHVYIDDKILEITKAVLLLVTWSWYQILWKYDSEIY